MPLAAGDFQKALRPPSPTSLLANSYGMPQKLSFLLRPLNTFASFKNKFLIATPSKSTLEEAVMGVEGFHRCLHSIVCGWAS